MREGAPKRMKMAAQGREVCQYDPKASIFGTGTFCANRQDGT
jgi:hypothetical protein